ncbi:phosphoserine transaminase [uncultured Candidatus Puniceispirillum sp.]|uniref:phosphoserine transaminase n=1 Tax=uncultured Candidatus Puniceispirillum sp. TaxID=1985115 RepID=UPI0032B12B64
MSPSAKPAIKPASPHFSCGPTKKRPGWSASNLDVSVLGRSHRAKHPKAKIQSVLTKMRSILGLPSDYHIAIVPGSNTGAVEMALWSLLGARGVDVLAWEAFGKAWVADVIKQLKIPNARAIEVDYGDLPDLGMVNFDNDVVFTWNGTTSGVRVPHGDWILADRSGLTIADATSACFAMHLPWDKLDVTTFSFQKVLGGEGAHGVIILSPRAVERLESYSPPWPMPKLFRMTKKGVFDKALFDGATINTPSMLVIDDVHDALTWAESLGGLEGLIARVDANFAVIDDWIKTTSHFAFLAQNPATVSPTSVTLSISDDWFANADAATQKAITTDIQTLLAEEDVALDIGAYRDAPSGLRIWAGATVETSDLAALMPWLDWAYETVRARHIDAA